MLNLKPRYSRTKMATKRRNHTGKTKLFNRFHAYKVRVKYYIKVWKRSRVPSRWFEVAGQTALWSTRR